MCKYHAEQISDAVLDGVALESPEEQELARRWPIALRELKALRDRIHDMGFANGETLPDILSSAEKKRISEAIYQALVADDRPELKRSVARRMADKIGNYLLWRRETSFPVIHELIVLLPWWLSHVPGDIVSKLRDIGLQFILNGAVLPIQTVWQNILDAPLVYMGHCACRSAGVVDDLRAGDTVFNLLSDQQGRLLLDRLVDRYENLVKIYGDAPDTDRKYNQLFRRLVDFRRTGDSQYRIETLFEWTYPHWEILPVHKNFTPSWIRSLHKNHKAHRLHKELVLELATILYLARGTIFTSMKLFDTPYTICSCPTPETGGGCTLTNWYYWGMSNSSLLPNESVYGRARDVDGKVLPCRYFPVRSGRECLGCGCRHEADQPRDFADILRQADVALAEFRHREGRSN